jgi:XTP/dITP diphosphohydrolase
MELNFVTGNAKKFALAHAVCARKGVKLSQIVLDIDEIQGEDAEHIIRHKAQSAFDLVGKPVVVSDDSWHISGLNGFPGPYMKSMNHWFTTEDFINLTKHLKDRTATVVQLLAYQDELETVVFRKDAVGTILKEPRGHSYAPWRHLTAMEYDDGLTIAEVEAAGKLETPERLAKIPEPWTELLMWYKGKRT